METIQDLWKKFSVKYLDTDVLVETTNKDLMMIMFDNVNVKQMMYNKTNSIPDETCSYAEKKSCGNGCDGYVFIRYVSDPDNPITVRYHNRCLVDILESSTKKMPKYLYIIMDGKTPRIVTEEDEHKSKIEYTYVCDDPKKTKERILRKLRKNVMKGDLFDLTKEKLDEYVKFIVES
jgi:hypothetical protein